MTGKAGAPTTNVAEALKLARKRNWLRASSAFNMIVFFVSLAVPTTISLTGNFKPWYLLLLAIAVYSSIVGTLADNRASELAKQIDALKKQS